MLKTSYHEAWALSPSYQVAQWRSYYDWEGLAFYSFREEVELNDRCLPLDLHKSTLM